MTSINESHLDAIAAACSENVGAIAESLNLCFDRQYRLEVGEKSLWASDGAAAEFDGPGLIVTYRVGQQGVLCLIPESLPLPEWYKTPGESENSRLQTLSLEWSINMLPAELEAEESLTTSSENLKQHVVDAQPADWAVQLELLVFEQQAASEGDAESESGSEQAVAKLLVVAAVDHPPSAGHTEADSDGSVSGLADSVEHDASGVANNSALGPADRRMMRLPMQVSVRLAEKKIELGQLASITPGGLVTFNKGSDSLLDLYVNNHLYGRGEAIKIGEKFGLKVTQVGVKQERPRRVL